MNDGSSTFYSESVAPKLKLHHLGFVVLSIQDSGHCFARTVGASWDEKIVFDPIQNVRVSFLRGNNSADPLIELVEPAGPTSPVSRFLQRGGGLHHLCYETEDLEAHLAFSKANGSIIVSDPVPAVAFDGRRIAWTLSKSKLLLEYLEAHNTSSRQQGQEVAV